ncbi:MAG: PA2778 family cysteine peptidase [Burkholderiales bacterium]
MSRYAAPAVAGVSLCAALLGLTGCATPQVEELLARPPAALPASVELASVPFFPQEEYQCGPAALAMALTHAGSATSPEALVPQVYVPGREGSLQVEMLAATRRHGLLAYRLAPRLEDVLREVSAGTPVIVLQNLALDLAPLWHYAVVIGYDLPREEITLRSGTTRRAVMTLGSFERTWMRGDRWAMLALAPERLPATVREHEYVVAAAALERVAPGAARRAYTTAVERWPGNLAAWIGQGNTAYTLRDLPGAEAAYREAIRRHPRAADAWNNLAQTLLELRQREEALVAAQRAVEIGGPRLAQYQATLKTIVESR